MPMPPFSHLHPALVHLPIALLPAAAMLVLLGGLWPAQRRGVHVAALLLLILGLLGALGALATGEAVEGLARRTPELREALHRHEQLAERATAIFGVLAAAWTLALVVPRLLRRELPPRLTRTLFGLWLIGAGWGVATLLLTGHEGGRMVHDLHTHGGGTP